jgi:hypothetical protein
MNLGMGLIPTIVDQFQQGGPGSLGLVQQMMSSDSSNGLGLIQNLMGADKKDNPKSESGPFMRAAQASTPTAGLNQRSIKPLEQQGRFGDSMIAHMTPGEIAVPPELQTPQVLATLNTEYGKQGVSPQQFQAGNPQASVNPETGVQEFSFLSSILPIALAVAGNYFAPGIGSSLGMAAGSTASAALPHLLSAGGAGLGTLLAGGKGNQALTAALASGLGGYAMDKAFGSASAAQAAKEAGKAGGGAAAGSLSSPSIDAGGGSGFNEWLTNLGDFSQKQATTLPWQDQYGIDLAQAAPQAASSWTDSLPRMAGIAGGAYLGSQAGAPVEQARIPQDERRLTPLDKLPPPGVLLGRRPYSGAYQ